MLKLIEEVTENIDTNVIFIIYIYTHIKVIRRTC